MLVDEIAKEVFAKVRDIVIAKECQEEDVRIAVLMSHDFFRKVCSEINGRVSSAAMELMNDKKIYGYPVYRVIDDFTGCKVVEI